MKKKTDKKSRKKLINLSKEQKLVIWIVAAVLFVILLVRYVKDMHFIAYYNAGITLYSVEEYDMAETCFKEAVWQNETGEKDCRARINLALSIVTPITPESVTSENIDETIERLNEAQEYLTENDCAHESDSDGHNSKAQILKGEIDEYIKQLTEQVNEEKAKEENTENTEGSKANQNSNTSEKSEEEIKKEQELEAKFEEIKKNLEESEAIGEEERFRKDEMYESWENNDHTYREKNW